MSEVNAKHEFIGSIQEVFAGITDYTAYPKYIPGVLGIVILEPLTQNAALSIRYEVNLIKKFHYTLNMFHEGEQKIYWTLEESNIMKKNDGSWTLNKSTKSDVVQAEYKLDLKFKGLVPSAITKKLTQTSLPGMFSGFQKLIDSKKT